MKHEPATPGTTAISGPWMSEGRIPDETEERGLAVIAVLPELERIPGVTPTRGMVAWINSGIGACETDEQAIATARLISAAPDLLAALKAVVAISDRKHDAWNAAHAAIAKAEGGRL